MSLGPFWRQTSDRLAETAPNVMICLELHPGVSIFSAAGFEALEPYLGSNIGLNFDPSHFWWQGIDPLTVIEALGSRIGHAHGKDTLLYPERIRRQGVLHFSPPPIPARRPGILLRSAKVTTMRPGRPCSPRCAPPATTA